MPTSITQHAVEALAGKCVIGVMLFAVTTDVDIKESILGYSWCVCVFF